MLTYTRGWSSWDRVINIYRPQRSCGKVKFLHLSVILFTGDGSAETPLPPGGHPSSQGDGSCSGGYASYWNPFLSWNSSHDPVTFYVVLTSGSTIENQNEYLFISARQWSCRKVTFSVVSVCLSTGGSLYTVTALAPPHYVQGPSPGHVQTCSIWTSLYSPPSNVQTCWQC